MPNNKNIKKYTIANKDAWEEAAPIHNKQNQEQLLRDVKNPNYSSLAEIEIECLNTIDVKGKDVAQICCNNGRELISIKNMRAARCVGFDIAQGFIDQSIELAHTAGVDIEFVCSDVYDIDEKYNAKFDVIIITIGVLTWMPDLELFFAAVSKLLKTGGVMFMYEQHPILDMVEPNEAGAPVVWEFSYFEKEPYVDSDGLDYWSGNKYKSKPMTSFFHTMSEIIMAGINNGFAIEHFVERPEHISNTWWNVESSKIGVPMSFTLIMKKT